VSEAYHNITDTKLWGFAVGFALTQGQRCLNHRVASANFFPRRASAALTFSRLLCPSAHVYTRTRGVVRGLQVDPPVSLAPSGHAGGKQFGNKVAPSRPLRLVAVARARPPSVRAPAFRSTCAEAELRNATSPAGVQKLTPFRWTSVCSISIHTKYVENLFGIRSQANRQRCRGNHGNRRE
jgi:hypothetical protein